MQGWERWVGDHGRVIGINGFGASAPGDRVMDEYGFTVANVIEEALALLKSEALSKEDRNNGNK